MNFPVLESITTTDVDYLSIDQRIEDAIEQIFNSEHQFVVIRDGANYFGLNIYDVFHISRLKIESRLPLSSIPLSPLPTLNKKSNILDALELVRNEYERIIVLDEKGEFYGLVTQTDLLSSIDPDTLMETFQLSDLLKFRKRTRWVGRQTITREIFEFMESYCHDTTMIVEDHKPVGIVTAKDMLRLLKKGADLSRPIEEYMSSPVVTLPDSSPLKEALAFMKKQHFKRIVVVDREGNLIGSITQKELIVIAYTRWVRMIEAYQSKLREVNEYLEAKSRKYEHYASIDPLTGLYNRMKFLELYVTEYTMMVQRQNDLSLMVIDLDRFKEINDRYGHNAGDRVLVEIADLLRSLLRSSDILCRWGGDEFVALLPTASLSEAKKIAEKIRRQIAQKRFAGIDIRLSASIGLSPIREGDELQSVIERADKALYAAKEKGRNRIEIAS